MCCLDKISYIFLYYKVLLESDFTYSIFGQVANRNKTLYCFFLSIIYFSAKSGIEPSETTKVVGHVLENCPNLEFKGLMTIGQYDYDTTKGPNPDFLTLVKCRQEVCENLKLDINEVELSMGMSTDFEHAVSLFSFFILDAYFVPVLFSNIKKYENLKKSTFQ